MENLPSKLNSMLGLDYSISEEGPWIQESSQLRLLIGILGILLPFLLWVFLFMYSGHSRVLESISHYYYTRVDSIFVLVIGTLAIFLIIYKGYEAIDFYLSVLAGFCAILLLLFPTHSPTEMIPEVGLEYYNTVLDDNKARVWVHYISAGLFLTLLALMSIFLFTKSNQPKSQRSKEKKQRNLIYRVCGIGMLIFIALIPLGPLLVGRETYDQNHLTFWLETVGVTLFGISWLVKGKAFLRDDE